MQKKLMTMAQRVGASTNKTAVVFGLFETGLGVIRALGRKGINVIGIDYKKDIASYSRYVTALKCPDPIKQETAFMNWLSRTFKGQTQLPVFLTGDDFLFTFSRNRDFLSQFFVFNLPGINQLNDIADKYAQFKMAKKAGINVPETWLVNSLQQLKAIPFDSNAWPLIIKGRDVNTWRAIFGGTIKGFRVSNYSELEEKVRPALSKNIPIIIQEVILGPDTNHYKYCAYLSKDGKTLAEFCLRKKRQHPIRFGIGSVVESVKDQTLLEEGRKFFQGIDYHGVGSAEFKYDEKDGKLKLIELNPRYWQQNTLAEACGVNFPFINYQDLLNPSEAEKKLEYKTNIKWVNIYMDFNSFLDYRREGELTFKAWTKSLKGPKVLSDFASDDILPAFWEIKFGLKFLKLPKFLWSKMADRFHFRKIIIKKQTITNV